MMIGNETTIATVRLIVLTMLAALPACGGGYDGSSSTPTAPSPTGAVGATMTLSATGVSAATPRIARGQRVRFTNNDSRPHQILSTPHGTHTDCSALNEIDMLSPGQSRDSGVLNDQRGCGFHDHLNPDDTRFRGQVLVGLSEADPVPPNPDY
jgi:plastocyanin